MSENCNDPSQGAAQLATYEHEEVERYFNYQVLMLINSTTPLSWTVSAKDQKTAENEAVKFMLTQFGEQRIRVLATEII